MAPDLTAMKAALAELDDTELAALIDATYKVPQTAPGLPAWIDHACDWELRRREGHDFTLRPPEAAIDPSVDAVSIDAAIAVRSTFAQDDRVESRAVLPLFDALVDCSPAAGGSSSADRVEQRRRDYLPLG